MPMRSSLCAAALLALSLGSAEAASLTYIIGPAPVPAPPRAADTSQGTVNQGLVGTVPGQYVSIWEGTAYFTTGAYTSVQGGAAATYHLDPTDRIRLIWGTPDSYNSLQFYAGTVLIDTVTGDRIQTQPDFGHMGAYLTIATGTTFDSVKFLSASNSFEFALEDPAPAAVPLPAAGLLLVGGLAGLRALARRRG